MIEKILSSASAAALVLALLPACALPVLSSDALVGEAFADSAATLPSSGSGGSDSGIDADAAPADSDADGVDAGSLPSEYYLVNLGFVTPAKLQSPWGTCWAFAVASAIESSILKASSALDVAANKSDATTSDEAGSHEADSGDAIFDDAASGGTGGFSHPMAAIRGSAVSAVGGDDKGVNGESDAKSGTGDADIVSGSVSVSMDAPDFGKLSDAVDVSERAIGWFAHEPQSEVTDAAQAGEGYVRANVDRLTQFEGGNFSIATAMLVARQALIPESAAPYTYNGYDGTTGAQYSIGTAGAPDARQQDWSIVPELRADDSIGWYVSGVSELKSPAITTTDMASGISTYEGYDPVATKAIKQAMIDVGAVAACLNSELSLPSELSTGSIDENTLGDTINYSTWSQYNPADSFVLNHAITLVGWDDGYPADAFRNKSGVLPPADGAWLCKNNWGSSYISDMHPGSDAMIDWGIRARGSSGKDEATGFFWLSYYDHSLSTPVAFEVSQNDDTKLYQYDYMGASEFFRPTTYTSDVLVSNVFTSDSCELISSVGGWTFEENETIHTYVYALGALDDEDDIGAGSITGEQFKEELASASLLAEKSVTFENAGYHEIDLDDPVLIYKGERFAVIQQVDTVTTTFSGERSPATYLSLEVAFTDTFDYENVVSRPVTIANDGETFVSVYGSEDWRSVKEYNDWYADLKAQGEQALDMVFGNALVKAVSKLSTMAEGSQVYEHVKLMPIDADTSG